MILLPMVVVILGVVSAVVAIGILDCAAAENENGVNTKSTDGTLHGLGDSVRFYQIRGGEDPSDL